MMRTQHYETISVTALCEKMDMPRKAFYRYFDSKDDALQALIEHTMGEYTSLGAAWDETGHRSLRLELEQFFTFWQKNRDMLDALDHSALLGKLVHISSGFPVKDMISLEKFLPNEPTWTRPHIFKFAICGLISMMLDWYEGGFSSSSAEMSALACRMLAHPLFPNLAALGIRE